MNVLCQYASGLCTQCGEPGRSSRTCKAGPNAHLLQKPEATPCQLLGDPTGEVALVKCVGCCGNVRKKYEVYRCVEFGACLPSHGGVVKATCGKEYQGCAGCDRNPATPSIPSTSPPPTPPPAE